MEPPLNAWITIQDDEKKCMIPYFMYRICCNQNVNGEISLFNSIIKNAPKNACIFDVGATGSTLPSKIKPGMSLHLFDPQFLPAGPKWKGTSSEIMFGEETNYDNCEINLTAVNDTTDRIDDYCKNKNIEHIHFLKIDTDGYDFGVLNGVGDVKLDMVQFEYDHNHRVKKEDINKMFKALPGWHFFYILPSGLIEIKEMRDDYIYTNIFASKVYPHQIIKDYEILLKDNVVKVPHYGSFMRELFWENIHVTADYYQQVGAPIDQELNETTWDLDLAMKNYASIYDR